MGWFNHPTTKAKLAELKAQRAELLDKALFAVGQVERQPQALQYLIEYKNINQIINTLETETP